MKQKAKLQEELKEGQVQFDVIQLLKTEHLDTKPNMAKFLKEHVSSIHTLNWSKICFYPSFEYEATKISVRFLDGHELIYDKTRQKLEDKFQMCNRIDEVQLKAKDLEAIERFFSFLEQFKFFY